MRAGPESEAGALTVLVRILHHLDCLFALRRRDDEAIVEGALAKNHKIAIGGELFSDAMGETGTYEGTYCGMLDHNITLVVRGLGGDAPEKGMFGKLSPYSGEGK